MNVPKNTKMLPKKSVSWQIAVVSEQFVEHVSIVSPIGVDNIEQEGSSWGSFYFYKKINNTLNPIKLNKFKSNLVKKAFPILKKFFKFFLLRFKLLFQLSKRY